MPSYRVQFVGEPRREPVDFFCVNDAQAMEWAVGLQQAHTVIEVFEDTRNVGRLSRQPSEIG